MAKRTIKKRRKWKFIPCLILCGLCGAILFEAGTLLAQFICASRDPFADYVIDPEKGQFLCYYNGIKGGAMQHMETRSWHLEDVPLPPWQ